MIRKVLLFHTQHWQNAARLAMAFRQLGCCVEALCLRNNLLTKLHSVSKIYKYAPLNPMRSLRSAITAADPSIVIPCDDGAIAQLIRLHDGESGTSPTSRQVKSIIGRSVGSVTGYTRLATRGKLPSIAADAQVPVPRTELVATVEELTCRLERIGFPAVLKADYSWSGYGVRMAYNQMDAVRAFRRLNGVRAKLGAIRRLFRDHDLEIMHQRFGNRLSALTLQSFVPGKDANAAVACWEGKVLACTCVEVLLTRNKAGNATVFRIIDNAKMLETVTKVIELTKVSGFIGFDFILEANTGRPLLIEINPRPTQINHLALGAGRDLAAALIAVASGEPSPHRPPVTERDTIALFPHEWHRDPESSFLRTAYHDVPWEEPELIRLNSERPKGKSGLNPAGIDTGRDQTQSTELPVGRRWRSTNLA